MTPRRFALVMTGTAVSAGLLGGWFAWDHGGDAVGNWIMAAQTVVGVVLIQFGLAYRQSDVRSNRIVGPLGVVTLAGPVFHFLPDTMSLGVRASAALACWVVAALWFIRARRSARSIV